MQQIRRTRSHPLRVSVLLMAAIALVSLSTMVHFVTEAWWFDSVGFSQVFKTLLVWRSLLWLGTFVTFALFLWGNYRFAMHLTRYSSFRLLEDSRFENYAKTLPNYVAAVTIFLMALAAAQASAGAWATVLEYFNASDFGITDPIYRQDIGFYIFRLPLYEEIQNWLLALVVNALVLCIPVYVLKGSVDPGRGWRNVIIGQVKNHISLLLAAIALLFAIDFWLQRYNLLYSERGVVFGAGYTDVHAQFVAAWVMAIAAVVLTVLLIFSTRRNGIALPVFGISIYLVVFIVFQIIYPFLEQQFIVKPNELAKEIPYITSNVELTRQAYGLNQVQSQPFPAEAQLNRQVLQENDATIRNVRLWDYEPLLSTYRQLQEIRLYYKFNDIDVDRYPLSGKDQQVMVSPRELAYAQVPKKAKTWINEHLKYTHGYGLAMSPVNRVTSQGLPEFLIKDVPPTSQPSLKITQPRIYYGEQTNTYIFTGSSTKEFDYPLGEDNAANVYDGTGGVPIPSLWHRLLYAYDRRSLETLFSGYFTPQSRIHYDRSIKQRISKVAPFLRLDRDPYIALIDGKLQWIADAYTVSDRYPYSEPISSIEETEEIVKGGSDFNYIRNSVKVLVDAYDGTMRFFVVDESDPLLQTFRKIFPDLFQASNTVPLQVKAHFRYPLDLFKIQAQMYLSYHMNNPEVFYNQEDLWRFPKRVNDGTEQPIEPYYITMRLPQEQGEEFVLILPFTPVNKDNMVAWMAARSDGENYGKLVVYEFPKQKLVYGPKQIEARIDQNPQISQLLTLWNQQGSKVVRGDLLVIPVQKSLLYIEPLYLKAEQGELPELKRVIVAYGEQIVMEDTLEKALAAIFGGQRSMEEVSGRNSKATLSLSRAALDTYRKAQQSAQAGNWTEYGRLLKELERLLQQLNQG